MRKKKKLAGEPVARIFMDGDNPVIRYQMDHEQMIQILGGLRDLIMCQQAVKMFNEAQTSRIIQASAKEIAQVNRGGNGQ